MWGWISKTAVASLVIAVAAVAVVFSPVSVPIATGAMYIAFAASTVALSTGCLYLGHDLTERERQEKNLNKQEDAKKNALQMAAIDGAAEEVQLETIPLVKQVNDLLTVVDKQGSSINQLKLEKENLEKKVLKFEDDFAKEQRDTQIQFNTIRDQFTVLNNEARRKNREQNANPGHAGMFGNPPGAHRRRRDAANDDGDQHRPGREQQQQM